MIPSQDVLKATQGVGIDAPAGTYNEGSEEALCPACMNYTSDLPPLYHELVDKDWFRLLSIEPGGAEDPIVCSLFCAKKTDYAGRYEALSYSWHQQVYGLTDQDPNLFQIYCNGTWQIVQPNLWYALDQLRHRHESRIIWVDALCIDQTNDAERSRQVQSMASIYTNAHATLIWLGPTTTPEKSLQALEVVTKVINEWDETRPAYFHEIDANKQDWILHRPEGTTDSWDCLGELFELTWFRRKWVIQEVVLSRSPQVLWGTFQIPWYFIGLASALMRTQQDRIVRAGHLDGVYNAYLMFRLSRHGGFRPVDLTFLQLLRLTTAFQTTDPRDRVYALLGLQTKDHDPINAPFIEVDYTKKPEELYIAVAEKLLKTTKPLQLLASVEYHPKTNFFGDSRVDRFDQEHEVDSSWIPTWKSSGGAILTPWSLDDAFEPAKGLTWQRIPNADPLVLDITGIRVSTVLYCGPVFENEDYSSGEKENSIMKVALSLLRSGAFGDPTADEALALFIRTLTAGRDGYGKRSRDSLSQVPTLNTIFAFTEAENEDDFVPPDDPHEIEKLDSLMNQINTVCKSRRLFVTVSGQLGLGPWQMLPGDHLWVLAGAEMPFILRRDGDKHRVLGECYVDDIMDGQAADACNNGTVLCKPHGCARVVRNLFTFDDEDEEVREAMERVKKEVVEQTLEQYRKLEMSSLKIR